MPKYGSALAKASPAPLGLVYVVLLAGALSGTVGQPPDFHQGDISIQGRLAFTDSHNGDQEWSLETLGSDEPAAYLLPGQPQDSITRQAVKPGSWVALSCALLQPDPVTNICTAVSGVYTMAAAAPVVSYGFNLRVLVMVLGLEGPECSYAPGVDVADVQRAFTARPGGYVDFFSNCSYGSVTLDPSAFRAIAVTIPCSRAQVESCMSTAMAPLAKRVARKVLGEDTYSQFNRYVYVMPKGIDPFCNWVGQAELPGTQSWYLPDRTGIFEQGTVMQEVLHNFGIWHGWRDEVEYHDYSSAMGLGSSCPSAPELSRLGWASPLAVLDSSSLPANTPVNVTLPATCLGPTANHLRIRPDWMGEAHVKNVYLALRSRCGGDLTLLEEFHNRVSVHDLDRAIDDSFTSAGDPRVQLVQVAGLGSRRLLPAYKLIVYPKVFLPGPRMTVEVCRWERRPTDCPTFWIGGKRRPPATPSTPRSPRQRGTHPPPPAYAGPWYGV